MKKYFEIELTKDDIIQYVKDNFQDDTSFLIELVDNGTSKWPCYYDVIKGLVSNAINANETTVDEILNS